MARGLLHGATILSFATFVAVCFAAFSPMWWTLRVESELDVCWHGEGIFHSNFWWGDDLKLIHNRPCSSPTIDGVITTAEAYCGSSPRVGPLNSLDKPDFSANMCQSMTYAKATSILAFLCACATLGVGLFMFKVRMKRAYELVFCIWGGLASGATVVFGIATCGIVLASDLFSKEHIEALSKRSPTQVGFPYVGYASCSFQTPLNSAMALLTLSSGGMNCLFPGPSFFVMMVGNLTAFLSMGFFFYLAYDLSVKKTVVSTTVKFNDDLYRNVRVYSIYGAFARKFSYLHSMNRFILITLVPFLTIAFTAATWLAYILTGVQVIGGGIFAIRKIDSKLDSRSLFFGTRTDEHTGQLLWHLQPGTEYFESNAVAASPLAQSMNATLPLRANMAETLLSSLFELAHTFLLQSTPLISSSDSAFPSISLPLPDNVYHRMIENIFNFSPTTALVYFWNGDARLVAIATGGSIFLLPIGKVMLFIYFTYAPSDEIIRGRMLFLLDSVGKLQLANLYVLALMGITLCITRDLIFPWFLFPGLIPKGHGLVITIRAGMNFGRTGFGAWMYSLTTLVSLLVGQIMLIAHTYASGWEEERRAAESSRQREESSLSRSSSQVDSPVYRSSSGQRSASSSSTERTVSVAPFDHEDDDELPTPQPMAVAGILRARPPTHLLSAHDASPVLSSSAVHPSVQNLMTRAQGHASELPRSQDADLESRQRLVKAFASFGSSTDIAGILAAEELGGNLRRLASYGSRATGLDVLMDQATPPERIVSSSAGREVEASPLPAPPPRARGGRDAAGVEYDSPQISPSDVEESSPAFYPPRLNRRESDAFDNPIHPFAVSLADRVHSPMQGVRLRWTARGRILLWLWIFFHAGFILICQSWDIIRLHRKGFLGDFILHPEDKYRDYSLVTIGMSIAKTSWAEPGFEITFVFFIMTALMPTAQLLGLAMMWGVPLPLQHQYRLFQWLELASAWASLDVFFLCVVILYIELPKTTESLVSNSVPNLVKLEKIFLPGVEGIISADFAILPGFWVLLVALVFEKITSHLVIEQAITAITERRAEEVIRAAVKRSGVRGVDTPLISDAAEGLLETGAAIFFGPAARYMSSSFPRQIYAGLPRSWWVKYGVGWGLLADAKLMARYDRTGAWPTNHYEYAGSRATGVRDEEESDVQYVFEEGADSFTLDGRGYRGYSSNGSAASASVTDPRAPLLVPVPHPRARSPSDVPSRGENPSRALIEEAGDEEELLICTEESQVSAGAEDEPNDDGGALSF